MATSSAVPLPGDARLIAARGLASLKSLWVPTHKYALRSSQAQPSTARRYPSATAHTIIALGEAGLLATNHGMAKEVFGGAVNPWGDIDVAALAESYVAGSADEPSWVTRWAEASQHGEEEQPRRFLILALVAQAAAHIAESGADLDDDTNRRLASGAEQIVREVAEILPEHPEDGQKLANDPAFRPFLLLQAVRAVEAAGRILTCARAGQEQPPSWRQLKGLLKSALNQHLMVELANTASPTHPYQDLPGLLFSFAGLVDLDPEVLGGPFAEPVIRGAIDGQRSDGCWSEGTAIVVSSGDVLQQSSMEVALELVSLARPQEALTSVLPRYVDAVRPISRAATHSLAYCDRTFHSRCGNGGNFSGWTSDRARWPSVAEAWATALVTRLALKSWQLERAIRRQELFVSYPVTSSDTSHPRGTLAMFIEGTASAEYRDGMPEPDQVLEPVGTAWTTFIAPLQSGARLGVPRPPDDQRSFILAGPPGSGKTYFVKQMARAIGWPLISLGPGAFITRGLERIEETASRVFRDLESLENVVVLLDECDELFRDRDGALDAPGSRTILSFATASMLPKLQDLHDRGQIITVLATNYIDRIDRAIKRPGRFDRRIFFDRPDEAARQRFAVAVLGLEEARAVEVAKASPGCTYKDLKLIAGGLSVAETSAPEYVDWILESGLAELNGCSATSTQRRKVAERWLKVVEQVGSTIEGPKRDEYVKRLRLSANLASEE